MSKAIRMAMAAALLSLTATACGGGYDRADTIDELVDEGGGAIDRDQATCIVDKLEADIGEDRLGSNDDPTAEEEQIIIDATFECVLGE